ncbi:hypothetical protein O6H91_08G081600 [Diphasiastrum complanatum]|uniref:Uncharacterized protein n=1 Tax=Diphasiastrum complanatum TaxID=34168 RepID=A0ACC2CZC9_DIPCM|nr:hypothetical protein O6H91_08G081600 [Diphasiastrum complanatum]
MAAYSTSPSLSSSSSLDIPTSSSSSSQTHLEFLFFSSADQAVPLIAQSDDAALQLIDELWFWENVLRWPGRGQLRREAVAAMEAPDVGSDPGVSMGMSMELMHPCSALAVSKDSAIELTRPQLEKPKAFRELFEPRMNDKGERLVHPEAVVGNLNTESKMEQSMNHPPNVMHQKQEHIKATKDDDKLESQKEPRNPITSRKPQLETITSGKQLVTESKMGTPLVRRRRREQRKRIKSLTDLEYDEVKGFRELGFNFSEDELTPRMVRLVPGLKPLSWNSSDATDLQSETSPTQRVYPSEDWWIRKTGPPIQKWRLPDPQREGIDMKEQLKFWARAVASNVKQEC